MKRSIRASLACATILAAGQAHAADSEVQELRDRVAALEAQSTDSKSKLQFSGIPNTTIELYGFLRFEAFYDADFAQGDLSRAGRVGDDAFATDGEFDTSVRVSRLGIRSNTDSDIGPIKTQLEFDLFGSGGDDSSSPNLRLRHANITINDQFLVGQSWTNFMPLEHYPTTADFNGPVGITFARVPQARYTYNTGNWKLSASIEEANGGGSDPVFTAAAFYSGEKFSLRAAALTGNFEADGVDYDTNGFTLSGSVSPWEGGTLTATYVTGEALGNLLIGGGARVVGEQTNDSTGYTLAINQKIGAKTTLRAAYGREDYDLGTQIGATGNAFTDLESIHLGVFYQPTERLTLAAEYINIESSGNGFSNDADRLGLSVTFPF